MTDSDFQLLRQYAKHQSEDAFAELVRRYVDLVYSAALRQVRSGHLAEEIVQAVFVDLARSASRLPAETVFSAWLYQVTRRAAIDVVRSESRRTAREQIAGVMSDNHEGGECWNEVSPLLDDGVASLNDKDRIAILLRFFEGKNLREVGASLGLSEGAAQKRVSRALDRLRQFFERRNIRMKTDLLADLVASRSVRCAPVGLGLAVSGSVAASTLSGALGVAQTIAMTTMQKTILTGAFTIVVGVGYFQHQRAERLGSELAEFRMQNRNRVSNLEGAQASVEKALEAALERNASLEGKARELPKLRAELARLRQEIEQSAPSAGLVNQVDSVAKEIAQKVSALKDQFEAAPDSWIPELNLVTEEDWVLAASGPLDSDANIRRAMSRIRGIGEGRFGAHLSTALKHYTDVHEGRFPSELGDLDEYLDGDLDRSLLDRWAIVDSADIESVKLGTDFVITQKGPVDDVFDQRHVIGPGGRGSTDFLSDQIQNHFKTLSEAFRSDHGSWPVDPSDLLPYVQTEEQRSAFEKWQLANSAKP